jgi:hypothetical protein
VNNFAALRITRASDTPADYAPAWLRLEQIIPADTQKKQAIGDFYNLLINSIAGLSARMTRPKGSPVEFDGSIVRFFLGFYVWPSSPAMTYQLTATIGEIGRATRVSLKKSFHLFADNIVGVSTPYYLEGAMPGWETPCVDRYGQPIASPPISDNHTHFLFGREIFGGLKITGRAFGYYHVLTVEIDKSDPDGSENKISNLAPVITATWQLDGESGRYGQEIDENGKLIYVPPTDQLRLEVPDDVMDILGACPNNPDFGDKWCQNKSDTQIYYSTCDSEILDVRTGANPRSYCTKVSLGNYLAWERGKLA